MKKSVLIALGTLLLLSVTILPTALSSGVLNPLAPGIIGNATIQWEVRQSPDVPFELFFSGTDYWFADNNTIMSFQITNIGEDYEGIVKLGNATFRGSDTDVARDLTLGVWGLTEWLPGLIIDTGEESLQNENDTAYASAERLYGNYLNGTMSSSRELVQIDGVAYNCITFKYLQDPTMFGEPLELDLSYDVSSGVLVYGNIYYSFGVPYTFEISLLSISTPIVSNLLLTFCAIIIFIGVIYYIDKR